MYTENCVGTHPGNTPESHTALTRLRKTRLADLRSRAPTADAEEYDEIVDMWETEAWTGKFAWQIITGNRDVLLPYIISDCNGKTRRVQQMIKRSQAKARKARAIRRQEKKFCEEMYKDLLVKMRDIEGLFTMA